LDHQLNNNQHPVSNIKKNNVRPPSKERLDFGVNGVKEMLISGNNCNLNQPF